MINIICGNLCSRHSRYYIASGDKTVGLIDLTGQSWKRPAYVTAPSIGPIEHDTMHYVAEFSTCNQSADGEIKCSILFCSILQCSALFRLPAILPIQLANISILYISGMSVLAVCMISHSLCHCMFIVLL